MNGTAFVEHMNTLIVNAHGALIPLKEPVREGQPLNLRNMTTGEEVHCTVVDLESGSERSAGSGRGICGAQSTILAGFVPSRGLEHAESGGQAFFVQP